MQHHPVPERPPVHNPVISGCHPDPSVCRVGQDYYLVCSSFAWFPAVPVLHSTDLRQWSVVGHVVDDEPGLARLAAAGADLSTAEASDGVWAPTIRHHDGVFYVVFATARGRRAEVTLLYTATDPRGPWSGPTRLDADGIDPSLFFDADGTCWFHAARDRTAAGATGPGEIYVRRLDLDTRQLTGPETVVWHGAVTGAWVEAPHVYARDGRYLLLAAEGGTEKFHSVVAAHADHPEGPWRTDPRSPLLTHRHLGPDEEFQDLGHADLVEGPDGRTWATLLGVRRRDGHHTTGREVFLVPVDWTASGPVFAAGAGKLSPTPVGRTAPTAGPERATPSPVPLTDEWFSSLRGAVGSTPSTAGYLDLHASPVTLDAATGTPAFLAFGQRDPGFEAHLEFSVRSPGVGDRGGLAVMNTTAAVVTAGLLVDQDGSAWMTLEGPTTSSAPVQLPPGTTTVRVAVRADEIGYRFTVSADEAPARELGLVNRRSLSTETAGGFLGVHLGPFATGAAGFSLRVHSFAYCAAETTTGNSRERSRTSAPRPRVEVPA